MKKQNKRIKSNSNWRFLLLGWPKSPLRDEDVGAGTRMQWEMYILSLFFSYSVVPIVSTIYASFRHINIYFPGLLLAFFVIFVIVVVFAFSMLSNKVLKIVFITKAGYSYQDKIQISRWSKSSHPVSRWFLLSLLAGVSSAFLPTAPESLVSTLFSAHFLADYLKLDLDRTEFSTSSCPCYQLLISQSSY